MNIHENSSKSRYVQKEVEVIKGIFPNSAKIKTLSLVEYQEAISKLIFSILGELVPRPRWIPKSKNAQVPYIKWHSTVRCGTHRYESLTVMPFLSFQGQVFNDLIFNL